MKKLVLFFYLFASLSSKAEINPKLISESVEKNHPLVLNSLSELYASEARIQSSRGSFDTKVIGEHFRVASGMWARTYSDILLEVPIQFNNSKFYAGHSYGFNGSFPPQFSTMSTNSGGASRVGVSTSLWRNRDIDANRGLVKINQFNYLIQEGNFNLNLWNLTQLGEIAYWEWVNSQKIQKIYKSLLQNAKERNQFLESRVERGALPKIVLRENEQYIARRKIALLASQERLNRASYALSLFNRDSSGNPVVPSEEENYEDYPHDMGLVFSSLNINSNLQEITRNRPEINNLELRLKSSEVDLLVARELIKPKFDVWGDYTRNIGNEFPENPSQAWSFGLKVEIPIERNLAKGSISTSTNSINAMQRRLQFEKERLESELRSTQKAITIQWQQIQQAQIERERSVEILEAENFKFKSGRGNLFLVNLREEALANAEASFNEATFKLMETIITYKAMTKINPISPQIEDRRF